MELRQKSSRDMRIIHMAFVVTWFLFLFMVQVVLQPSVHSLDSMTLGAIALAALSSIATGWALRNRNLAAALETLARQPGDPSALARWRTANILSFTFAETATLFGLLLKVLGASWAIAGWFFAGGLFLLLLWAPRLELPINTGASVPPHPPLT
jgi:hypothetical protein